MRDKKREVESDLLENFKQKEIKWELLTNPEGGVFCLKPYKNSFGRGLDDMLFFVDKTCIGFYIQNWRKFFKNKNEVLLNKSFKAHIQVTNIAPLAISEGGPFIGSVEIVHLVDS